MASSNNSKQTSQILKTIKSISSKDPSTTAIAISQFSEENRSTLLKSLQKVDRESTKKERSEESKSSDQDKTRREVRFMERLKEKMRSIKNERIVVKTRFSNAKNLCTADVKADMESMRVQFGALETFVKDLEVLACLARKKQAEVVAILKEEHQLTTEGVANELMIDLKFAQRLFTFHGLIKKYPNLVYSGYSFETLHTFKRVIEKEAADNVNFSCLLENDMTVVFEGTSEEEADLLDEATQKMDTSSIDD